jgi:hypothetical protein
MHTLDFNKLLERREIEAKFKTGALVDDQKTLKERQSFGEFLSAFDNPS